jgi:hypothetical protein
MRELAACSNARDILRRLALFSDDNLRRTFPEGPSAAFTELAEVPATPQPREAWVALLSVRDARLLPDGRAMAVVTVDNPTRHTHIAPGPGTPTSAGQEETARIVFVRSADGSRWLIDDVIQ